MRKLVLAVTVLGALVVVSAAQADRTTTRFRHYVASRYHERHPQWAVCPKAERQPTQALCQAQFSISGRRWRFVSLAILPHGKTAVPYTTTWVRKWHLCQQGPIFGKLVANAPQCSSYRQLVGDLETSLFDTHHGWPKALFIHGTNGAGFEARIKYKCTNTGRRTRLGIIGTATCTNALGDSFRYTLPTS